MFEKEKNMITMKAEMADLRKKDPNWNSRNEKYIIWNEKQNIVDGSNIRLDIEEGKVSKLKDIATEITLNKTLKKKMEQIKQE